MVQQRVVLASPQVVQQHGVLASPQVVVQQHGVLASPQVVQQHSPVPHERAFEDLASQHSHLTAARAPR